MTSGQPDERLLLDLMLRVLFRLSKRATVGLINGLFGENFTVRDVKSIHYGNPAFVTETLDAIIGDQFLRFDTRARPFHYHVEFQTLNDRRMVVRLFRYGFEKAAEAAMGERGEEAAGGEPLLLAFPAQVVIFLEENSEIGETLEARLKLPGGAKADYIVPVLRLWTLTPQQMAEKELYALLPLQAFNSRKRLRAIVSGDRSEEEKARLLIGEFERLKRTVEQTLAVISGLHERKILLTGDMDRMLRVLGRILRHLYRKYGGNRQAEEEADLMVKTYIDPEVRRQGREEGKKEGIRAVAQNMLKLGIALNTIVQATELSEKEVLELSREK